MNNFAKHLAKLSSPAVVGIFVAVFAVIGVLLLAVNHASSPDVSVEAVSGTLADSATAVPGSDPSGGQAIKFGSGSSS
jgi:hypothetical protein